MSLEIYNHRQQCGSISKAYIEWRIQAPKHSILYYSIHVKYRSRQSADLHWGWEFVTESGLRLLTGSCSISWSLHFGYFVTLVSLVWEHLWSCTLEIYLVCLSFFNKTLDIMQQRGKLLNREDQIHLCPNFAKWWTPYYCRCFLKNT